MSFILDALKKSENARQRQAGPSLFEVKVAPPRRGLPAWALAIGILLLVNVLVLTWMMVRRPGRRASPDTRVVAGAPIRPVSAGTAPPHPAASVPSTPSPVITAGAPAASATPSPAATAVGLAPPAQSAPAGSAGDYAPALQPPPAAGVAGTLPLYGDIASAPDSNLPPLHLDLHVYAADPRKRFVMIDMQKLREGDSLANGVTVVAIRPDGVVLSFAGRQFLLPR